jgi:photosystem II stability/assembly factor-like uncharacterized protein
MKTVVTATLLVLAATSFAAWESIGPEGGPFYCGTVAPTSPPTVYAAASMYNLPLMKSTDGGANWTGAGASMGNYPWVLTTDPANPNILYGVISSLFYRSTNGGSTWTTLSIGSNTIAYDLAVNPRNPQVMYAGGYWYDGSYWRISAMKSTDNGSTWAVSQLDTATTAYGYSVAIDPVDTNVVYVGGYAGSTTAFYKSTDCGANWTRITWPENDYYVYSLMVDPTNHSNVLAGTLYGICRSTDQGETWVKVSSGNYHYRLTYVPGEPATMYSAAYSTVYRSTDAGISWNPVSSGIQGTTIRTVLTVPGENATVFCGSTAGMYKSTDYGATWNEMNNGILIGSIPVISTDANLPGGLQIQFRDNAIFKSPDNGGTWERQPVVLSCGNVCNIVFDPSNPQHIWMFEGSG